MDPALRREKEAFKQRAIASAEKSKKSREAANKAKASVQSTQIKKSITKRQIESGGKYVIFGSPWNYYY